MTWRRTVAGCLAGESRDVEGGAVGHIALMAGEGDVAGRGREAARGRQGNIVIAQGWRASFFDKQGQLTKSERCTLEPTKVCAIR